MKTIILRSALIAVVLAPMVALLSVLPLKAIKYVPPIDEREFESMSYREAMAQMRARSRELTTFEWLEEFSRRPFFWAGLVRSSVVPFAAIFRRMCVAWLLAAEETELILTARPDQPAV